MNEKFKNYLFKKTSVFLIASLLVLIFLHYIKILKPIENLVINFLKPIQTQVYSFGDKISEPLDYLFEKKNLKAENKDLRKKISELQIEIAHLKQLEEENKILKMELEYIEEKKINFVLARVLGRSLNQNFSSLLIDKGRKQGLKKGEPVIVQGGIMIGKIARVEDEIAHLALLSSNQSEVAVTFPGNLKVQGLVKGEHNIGLKMELIPQDIKIKIGDLVITSGLEKEIPEGLLVGKISKIETRKEELFLKAILEPLISFDNLKYVTVILSEI